MRAYDLIRKKRDGGVLQPAELEFLVRGATDGSVADEQLAAFLMAVFFRGLEPARELPAWLTAMLRSGQVLDLSRIPGRKVDKHSTGGVGDKISLPLAPLAAVCGVRSTSWRASRVSGSTCPSSASPSWSSRSVSA